jgi:hypothetical protein
VRGKGLVGLRPLQGVPGQKEGRRGQAVDQHPLHLHKINLYSVVKIKLNLYKYYDKI